MTHLLQQHDKRECTEREKKKEEKRVTRTSHTVEAYLPGRKRGNGEEGVGWRAGEEGKSFKFMTLGNLRHKTSFYIPHPLTPLARTVP